MNKPNNVRVTMCLTPEIRKILYDLAQKRHQTLSQVVRDAIVEYNKRNEA